MICEKPLSIVRWVLPTLHVVQKSIQINTDKFVPQQIRKPYKLQIY